MAPVSHIPQGSKPRKGAERDTGRTLPEQAGENKGSDRDLFNGEGGSIEVPVKPGDVVKDD